MKDKWVLPICAFLIVATTAVYWGALHHDFLTFDDPLYVTENARVQSGLTIQGLVWALKSTEASNWHPLTWISHMVDVELYGLNPAGHHFTSLALHIINALLLFLLLFKTTGAPLRSGWVSALFALHPQHVESVAWISERKDVLSAFFWILTLWAFVRYAARPDPKRYALVLLTFCLGLMSKPMVVTLPFVLLLLDFWPLNRFKPDKTTVLSLVVEKLPLFALSIGASILTLVAQQGGGAVISLERLSLCERLAHVPLAYVTYISKLLWPHKLTAIYPFPDNIARGAVLGVGLLLAFVTLATVRLAKRQPAVLVGWFWFLGTLVPVIGLVQVGSHFVADRYTYIPSIGLFAMLAWGMPHAWPLPFRRKILAAGAATAIILTLLGTTWRQVGFWENDLTLFRHAAEVTPDSRQARNNFGDALFRLGKVEPAIEQYREALRIEPKYVEAHNNLGVALAARGNPDEAMTHYAEALRIEPDYAKAHYNYGVALALSGKTEDAIGHYSAALKIKPDYAKAHYSLGVLYATRGDLKGGVFHFSQAVQLKPDLVEARYSLAIAYLMLGNQESALRESEALRAIRPELAESLQKEILRQAGAR